MESVYGVYMSTSDGCNVYPCREDSKDPIRRGATFPRGTIMLVIKGRSHNKVGRSQGGMHHHCYVDGTEYCILESWLVPSLWEKW